MKKLFILFTFAITTACFATETSVNTQAQEVITTENAEALARFTALKNPPTSTIELRELSSQATNAFLGLTLVQLPVFLISYYGLKNTKVSNGIVITMIGTTIVGGLFAIARELCATKQKKYTEYLKAELKSFSTEDLAKIVLHYRNKKDSEGKKFSGYQSTKVKHARKEFKKRIKNQINNMVSELGFANVSEYLEASKPQ